MYLNPHFIARRPRLVLVYQPLSDGEHCAWSLGVPFYQTAARWQVGTNGEASRYQVLSIPTAILFEGGEARETVIGARPRSYYENAWAAWLTKTSSPTP